MSGKENDINRDWSPEGKLDLHRQMTRIRAFEMTALKAYLSGKMGGWLFLTTGQEMIPAVVRSLMKPEDHSISGPRGMGHAIVAGMEMNACMAELFGKSDGCSKGKGGAISFFDPARGFWGCH
ncbi:MAG: pyruvate dehydrogenase (acetyl-transferring) E1 component subunit alpha, partial [Verrucomicrobiaceae bacterium]